MVEGKIFCKVCRAPVKRRRDFQPRACEACKKFFIRMCQQQLLYGDKLVCSYASKCEVQATRKRRRCRKCRFDKCISVGMSSKFLRLMNRTNRNVKELTTSTDGEESSCKANQSSTLSIEGITQTSDHVDYEWQTVERVIKSATVSFTHLHDFEFLELKRIVEPVDDFMEFVKLAKKQIQQLKPIIFSYGQSLTNCEAIDLSESDMTLLVRTSLASILALYSNLPGNPGATMCSMSDKMIPKFFSWFPDIQESLTVFKDLAHALENWRPSLAEVSILTAALFLVGERHLVNTESRDQIQAYLGNLSLALDIWNCRSTLHDDPEMRLQRRSHFDRCYQLALCAGNEATRCSIAISSRDPLFLAMLHQISLT